MTTVIKRTKRILTQEDVEVFESEDGRTFVILNGQDTSATTRRRKPRTSRKKLPCPHCEFKARNEAGLNIHLGRMHKTEPDEPHDEELEGVSDDAS